MTDWQRKKLLLEQETGQVYTRLKNTNTKEKQLKQRPEEKNWKNNGIYNIYHASLSQQWIVGVYWSPTR